MLRRVLLGLLFLPATSGAQTFTAVTLPPDLVGGLAPAIVDIDGDGRTDVLSGQSVARQTDGGWEVSVLDDQLALGVLVADWSGDGAREVAVLGAYRVRPARWNRARGALEPLAGTGLETPRFNLIQGSVLLDDDRDGRLDLLIGNDGPPDVLLRQRIGGTFDDLSASVLPGTEGGTYGMAAADFDRDGDLDVAVGLCAPLPAHNLLYLRGASRYTEVGASTQTDDPRASWGMAWLDYDGDGWLDLFVANMPIDVDGQTSDGANGLFRNNQDGTFTDVAGDAGVAGPTGENSWSAVAADFDNDGWTDLAVANRRSGTGAAQPWRLWRNTGGQFEDVTPGSGLGSVETIFIGAGDVDGDGWVDLVGEQSNLPVLLRNGGGTNAWLGVRLRGLASNTEGIGARVEVASGGRTQVREITGGDGFMAQSHALEAHVGLGTETTANVTVRWPSGQVDVVTGVTANQRITIVEGEGRNDAPEAFALIAPASSAELASTEPATFSWAPSADEGPVTYSLLIEHDGGTALTYSTTETSFTVPQNDLFPGPFSWAVVANDGRSERTSLEARAFSFVVVDAAEETPEAGPALTLGPNPARSHLRVQVADPAPATLTVLDARGRRVLTERVAAGEATLDLRALPPGAYTVRVESTSGVSTAPFVLAR
ncbi:FG-GAP-like repeat-containing protein [Rubricoccus marinus]|uniref:ASPIC/UnbV domain-containing protein n=1 Tax=Rubricoccus marinus TaxID=716817 RepID=A0A259U1X1_9BACT|nr:FG-GAP-like repeat-containing protein [Rubricoccus marinus]OZC04053.1 hypothetical protein BSZ36_14300 [Rubricoccus marinus]